MTYDPIHPEGIYRCEGCGRTYPEYINGCVADHLTFTASRRVQLVVRMDSDEDGFTAWQELVSALEDARYVMKP